MDHTSHRQIIQEFITSQSQLRDIVSARSNQKKIAEADRFNRGIIHCTFVPGDLVLLYQNKTGKLEPRWRGPFFVEGFGGTHETSYIIRQLNGRGIRGTFHGNHLKKFVPRTGYLEDLTTGSFPTFQTIRKRETRGRKT